MSLSFGLGLLCLVAADLSVGVAPFTVLGIDEDRAVELRQAAADHLVSQRRDREVLSLEQIDQALADLRLTGEELHDCLRESTCAARIARGARADELLIGSAAGLGRTYELRLALVDAQRGVIAEEVQQTVEGDSTALATALRAQVDRLVPPARPWYRSWWFWTVTVGVVVAAAVVTTVLLLLPDETQVDTYPLP